jgi:hypothetical protein
MKKLYVVSFLLVFVVFFVFCEPENQEEIDYLLFLPNSGSQFVNEAQAAIQLDDLAKYLLGRGLAPGQIYVYGYSAFAVNDIDPLNLSRERALFVISELQRRGVPGNLFSDPVGYGAVDLWGGNTNEEDRIPNRRVRVVLDGNTVTPETIKDSGSEIIILSYDEKERSREAAKEKSGFKFPWLLLLLLLLLIAALIYLLSKRKKSPSEKPAKPAKPAPIKREPVVKAEPIKAAPIKLEPVAKAEPKKPEPAKAAPPAAPVIITTTTVKLDEEIRLRAYELFQERGSQHGNNAGDWYSALFDVCAKYESAGYRIYFEDDHWWASLQETKPA